VDEQQLRLVRASAMGEEAVSLVSTIIGVKTNITQSVGEEEFYQIAEDCKPIFWDDGEGKLHKFKHEDQNQKPPTQYYKDLALLEIQKPRYAYDKDKVMYYADNYCEETKHMRLVFHNVTRDKLIFSRYTHMLMDKYSGKLYHKFSNLKWDGVGVTLTLKSDQGRSIYSDIKRMYDYFRRFVQRLKRKLPHFKIDYLKVMEIGKKTGVVHLHVIFFGINYIPQCWVRDTWKDITKNSYIVWVSPRNKKAKDYISKYFFKTMKGKLDTSLVQIWASRNRSWSASRGLFERLSEITVPYVNSSGDVIEILGLWFGDKEGVYVIEWEKPPPYTYEVEVLA